METSVSRYERRVRWMAALKGLVLILLGIVALFYPIATILTFAIYVGITTLVTGFIITIAAIVNHKVNGWGWALAEGILDIIFGIVLLSYPFMTAIIFPIMVGFWIFFGGVLQISTSIAYRSEVKSWWLGLLFGIVAIMFAFWILYTPVSSAFALTYVIGIFAMVFGLYYIINAITHKRIAF
ncbi:HdeD family acid-resistance protein [Sporocytophaga myxococcoides]|nr:HdeD family acid-resistance protein [Sporocytophaga myxococcoides]